MLQRSISKWCQINWAQSMFLSVTIHIIFWPENPSTFRATLPEQTQFEFKARQDQCKVSPCLNTWLLTSYQSSTLHYKTAIKISSLSSIPSWNQLIIERLIIFTRVKELMEMHYLHCILNNLKQLDIFWTPGWAKSLTVGFHCQTLTMWMGHRDQIWQQLFHSNCSNNILC